MKPEDHEHEIGEPTENCVNCQLDRIEDAFSAFETGIWNWYFEHVNRFTLEAGIIADEFRRAGPARVFRKIALSGLNAIYLTFRSVAEERALEERPGKE